MTSKYDSFINAFWIVANVAAVVGIVTANKLVFTHFKFHFGTLLTVIHFAVTSVFLELGKVAGWIERKKGVSWLQVVPLSMAFCGFVVLTNLSLQYNSIGFYQMAKVMTTPMMALLQFAFYNKKFSRGILASLAVTCIGVLLATGTEVKLTLIGLLIAMSGCLATAIYSIWVETEQQRLGLNAMQLLSYQAPLSALLLVGFVPLFDNYKEILSYKMTVMAAAAIGTSAFLAFLVNMSTFMIIGKMSAITYNVAGHAKLCFILASGYLLFDNKFNLMNMVGVTVAISGVVAYSIIKMLPPKPVDTVIEVSEPEFTVIKVTEEQEEEDIEKENQPKRSLLIVNNEPILSGPTGDLDTTQMSSSWKDSSDFASLAAALSKAKKPVKTVDDNVKKEGEQKLKEKCEPKIAEITGDTVDTEDTVITPTVYSDFPEPLILPLAESLTLKQHKSTVSALEFEGSGSRFLSGSHDMTVAYWDFNGMVREQPEPFRFIEPMGSYPIRSLKYSRDSQWVLMAASSSCVKLFDRNGSQVREFGKGDPYIRDLKHTTGHVAGINTAIWLPYDPDRFLTASEDGTLRIWHMGMRHKSETVVTVKSSVAGTGGRSSVTAAAFANDEILLTGSADGSVKLWNTKSLSYPSGTIPKAHVFGEKICSFAAKDNVVFASRSTDGTVKLWDRRNLSSAVQVYDNLPTIHSETSVIFVHDKLITGTSEGIAILDPNAASSYRRTLPRASAVVSVAWNERTDQILAGSADGRIEVLFDRDRGNGKGVLLMRQSASASRIDGEADISAALDTTGTNAMRAPSKRKLDKIRSDPVKTHRPELPTFGPGQGGKIGSNVTQTIMRSVLKDTSRDVDPRAALLAYADQAARNPMFVSTAYQETQPVPVLDASLLEKEVAVEEEKRRKLEEVERLKAEKEKMNNRFK